MMSEKLCLQWNNFKDIKNSAFGNLSNNVDFADVTLTCGKSEIFYGDNTEKAQTVLCTFAKCVEKKAKASAFKIISNQIIWKEYLFSATSVTRLQGCIFRSTCSHPELTKDHVLTSACVEIFKTVTTNAVNKSIWRKKD